MKTIATLFLICFSSLSLADKIEFKDVNSTIVYEIRSNGQTEEIKFEGKSLFCPKRNGNRGYRDKQNIELYRVSRKADHITIYQKNTPLYRLSLNANKFDLKKDNKRICVLKTKGNTATLYSDNHQIIGKVNFDGVSKNKIKSPDAKTLLSYKTAAAQFGGAFLLIKEIPLEIRLILVNEFIDK